MKAVVIEIAATWRDRVDRSGGPGSCWPWIGPISPAGYGQTQIRLDGRSRSAGAHQVAHYVATGRWEGAAAARMVRHLCHNRPCCNPDHLVGGTAKDNALDLAARNRGEDLLAAPVHRSPPPAPYREPRVLGVYQLPVAGTACAHNWPCRVHFCGAYQAEAA